MMNAIVTTVLAAALGGAPGHTDPHSLVELQVQPADRHVAVGQELTAQVVVRNAPAETYGADVRVEFDFRLLEVLDADGRTPGLQLAAGGFIPATPGRSFILQNAGANDGGTADYAVALLNPAPPVHGDGTLVQIRFKAKASGTARIAVTEGLLGTRRGRTNGLALDRAWVDVEIGGSSAAAATEASAGSMRPATQASAVAGGDPAGLPRREAMKAPPSSDLWVSAGIALAIVLVAFVVTAYRLRTDRERTGAGH